MVINCKKPCKKKRSTMLTVEQMVDVALGTPEIGAVNFNVLHALIHVIIQQLNIQKCLVEFKGYDSERMEGIIMSAKPGPILKLSEYMIDVNDGKSCQTGKEKSPKQSKDDEECKEEAKEAPAKRPPCECTGKKRKVTDEEKVKEESDAEKKTVIKKEPAPSESEDTEEPEPKKIREVKKPKPCPCKGKDQAKEGEVCADEGLKAVPSSYYGSDSEGTCQTIVRVEPVGERCDSWRSRPALAHESMVRLEEKVAMLQDAFEALEQMPTNEELKKRTQGTSCVSTPVKDLWQLYNLNKRVESCEGTIEKLASMIEDLVKESCNVKEAMMVIAGAVDEIECADQTGRSFCAALQARSGGTALPAKPTRSGSKAGEIQTVTFSGCDGKPCTEGKEPEAQPQTPRDSKASEPAPAPPPTPNSPSKPRSSAKPGSPLRPGSPPTSASPPRSNSPTRLNSSNSPPIPTSPPSEEPENPAEEQTADEKPASAPLERPSGDPSRMSSSSLDRGQRSKEPETETKAPEEEAPEAAPTATTTRGIPPSELVGIGPEFYKMSAGEKFCVLKEYVDCLVWQIKQTSESLPTNQITSKLCAIVSVQKQLDGLEREWREFLATFGTNGVLGLNNTLVNLREDIDRLAATISKLKSEQKETGHTITSIVDEARDLRRVKADLELVEDLLASKADAALMNRKVSHDQFDAACDDLTRGLDEALDRLLQQEALWNEAMEELHKGLDSKLDKIEIMPLKEFINKKLKCLQEKLKQLAQLRKDAEAAGAKSRIIRNLNCIACDADVVMKMDNRSSYRHSAMTPSKSLKPMLTYELDQVRKAMKKGIPCRGANHVEEAILDAQKKAAGIPLTTREAVDSKVSKLAHFCNRYCGGSHTITTPQQRVTRIGHFLTEFGPQAMAIFNQEFDESKTIQQGLTPSMVLNQNTDLSKPC